MTTTLAGGPAVAPDLAGLSYHSTVDRRLLHRSALSEVFLTDCRRIDEHRYAAAAQLPPLHAYYTDHLKRTPLVDPILLLECVRQAETYGGHAMMGVPADAKFILRDWSLHLTGPDVLVRPAGPVELGMVVTTSCARRVGGALRALVYDTDLVLAGRPAGKARISVGYLSAESYVGLRAGRRGSPPPSSTTLAPAPVGMPVSPYRVGRSDPDNVLLRDIRVNEGGLTARVRAAVDHPSMFDHAQDHLPGMVMTEAARQAGLVTLDELYGRSPARWVLTGMDAGFSAYAELDAPTLIRVRPAFTAGRPDTCALIAEFEQDGSVIADVALSLSEIGRR
jgi:hypothetical protein